MWETLHRWLNYHNHIFSIHHFKVFSKIMTVWQEVMERTNSPTFCWSTNNGSFSTDMYGRILHTFSVGYNFCNAFSSETACGPQFDKHCFRHFSSVVDCMWLFREADRKEICFLNGPVILQTFENL
jgi:hypothetical protein